MKRLQAARFFFNAALCLLVGLVVLAVGVRQVVEGAEWVDVVWFLLVGAIFLGFGAVRHRAAARLWRRANLDAVAERQAEAEAEAVGVTRQQVAGSECVRCRARILTVLDGRRCSDCGGTVHDDCCGHQSASDATVARSAATG